MKVYNDGYKNFIIITSPKTIRVDLAININEGLKLDIHYKLQRIFS